MDVGSGMSVRATDSEGQVRSEVCVWTGEEQCEVDMNIPTELYYPFLTFSPQKLQEKVKD